MKKYILLAAAALVAASCGQKAGQTLLSGMFGENAPAQVHVQTAAVDTVLNVSKGAFSFSVPTDLLSSGAVETEVGQLSFVPDGSKLTFDFTGETPKVTSSDKASVTSRLNTFLDKARELAAAVRAATDDVQGETLYAQYVDYNKQTLLDNKDNFLGMLALQNVYYEMEPQELLDVIGNMAPALQEQEFVQSVKTATEAVLKTGEGAKFVDFEIEEEPGKVTKLSDFVGKGKYMLVDFWASWCGPCKREMPNVVAAYEKYHAKGFEIVGLSFDNKKDAWIAAITEWNMPWIHLSDVKGWDSLASSTYYVRSIPDNLLIDPTGKIVARGLRGPALGQRLAEIYGN